MSSPVRVLAMVGLTLLATACGNIVPGAKSASPIDASNLEEAWDANNNPRRLKDRYEVRLSALPTSGSLTKKPWTDTYWPSHLGGIANRWNDPGSPGGFNYTPPTQQQAQQMSINQLARLSPAEKFDLYAGRFDYPLVDYERQRTHPTDPGWFGLCHGWAPAAINFDEPKPVTLRGPSGIAVPFGSSDIKALLTFSQQYKRDGMSARMLGGRCDRDMSIDPAASGAPECRDVNAGSFHIILTNQIALLKEAFTADVTRDVQVWNQPVHGYRTQILGYSDNVYPGAAPGTVRIAQVRTQMSYILEYGPAWQALPYSSYPQQAGAKTYNYRLELDQSGAIIGGEWDQEDRPDFLWTQTKPEWTEFFEGLKAIYAAAGGH